MATEVIDQFRDNSNQQLVNAGDSANNAVRVNVVVGGGGGSGTSTVVQGTASNLNATVVGTVTTVPSGTQTVAGTVAATESGVWTVTVTQATAANLNATVVGTVTSVPSGTTSVTVVGTLPVSGTITNVQSGTATDVVSGTVTSVPSGTQTVTLVGTETVVGTVNVAGIGTGSVNDLSLTQSLSVRDNDLIGRLDTLIDLLTESTQPQDNFIRPLGQVGPRSSSDGQFNTLRLDRTNALVTANAHAMYKEPTLAGNMFASGNTSYLTFTNGGTAMQGIVLSNPANSGKNLVLNDLLINIQRGTAAGVMSYTWLTVSGIPAAFTGTTTLPIVNSFINGPAAMSSVAVCYQNATNAVAAGQVYRFIGVYDFMTVSGVLISQITDRPNGALILAPGSYITVGGIAASGVATTQAASISWEEIAI